MLVAEHRLWWLADVVDRVVVMDRGRVAFDGAAREFAALSRERRRAWGLRAWSVDELIDSEGGVSGVCGTSLQPGAGCLSVEGLHAGHKGGRRVLSGLDALFPAGAVTALVGRNGAGKTTLARCLVGLHGREEGRIAFSGKTPARRARPRFAYLAMQETGYQLFSDSVRGELEDAAADARGAGSGMSVDDLLARFDLDAVADRHPLSLSGGQRQRLAIAAGIAQGRPIWFLTSRRAALTAPTWIASPTSCVRRVPRASA